MSARYHATSPFDREEAFSRAAIRARACAPASRPTTSTRRIAVHGWTRPSGCRPRGSAGSAPSPDSSPPVPCFSSSIWTSAVGWPLNVGGKPFNSLPGVRPRHVRVPVLFGGSRHRRARFSCRSRLLSREREPDPISPRVTDDRFVAVYRREGRRIRRASARRAHLGRTQRRDRGRGAGRGGEGALRCGGSSSTCSSWIAMLVAASGSSRGSAATRPESATSKCFPDMAQSAARELLRECPISPTGRRCGRTVAGTVCAAFVPLALRARGEGSAARRARTRQPV